MMLQLNPPLPLKTPKGEAWAVSLIDYGPQWDLLWVTFVVETGECWTFQNRDIRRDKNYTFGLSTPTPITHAPETKPFHSQRPSPYPGSHHFGAEDKDPASRHQ